ncbi:MAG: DUF1003 domain-containing protein [Candidatus Nomurabacteria bacterium]|nr:DUF1003 domain-containing protein [Candidatus Nomurabacteria bacterium]
MIRNVNKEHKAKLNTLDKVAIFITKVVGTMWCAIAFTILALISLPEALSNGTATTISWIAQTFLQLVLLSIIMVGQNLQSKHSELRAEADYETDMDAKKDVENLLKRLDDIEQNKLDKIIKILEDARNK